MPTLPSGLEFALSRHALFDHGGNWFNCPEGHFWYWDAAPEMGPPPYDLDAELLTGAKHALAPATREEAKAFIQVLEMNSSGMYAWGGEWLSQFPYWLELDQQDLEAWNAWLRRPETDVFLDETIEKCKVLAADSQRAKGYAVLSGMNDQNDQPDEDGWRTAQFRNPRKLN